MCYRNDSSIRKMCKDMKYIIFGTGKIGKQLFQHLNRNDVQYFCDNDKTKCGKYLYGIEVIPYEKLLTIYESYIIFIAMSEFAQAQVRAQLEDDNICNYILYENDSAKSDHDNRIIPQKAYIDELMHQALETSNVIDPIQDYIGFRGVVEKCKRESDGKLFYESDFKESTLYGYGKALMDYAGINEDYDRFPIVSHIAGISYPNEPLPLCNFKTAATVFGMRYKKLHNKKISYVPIFAVGPYIQYASTVWPQNIITEKKNKNKKTALVFLSHSIENSSVHYDEEMVTASVIKHLNDYDTVIVCAYWHDIDKPVYEVLHKAGIKVVSAGFRWDSKFVCRLRTLLELCDDAIFYGYSTAVIFAACLNRNIIFYNVRTKYDLEECLKFYKPSKTSEKSAFSEANIDKIKKMKEDYGFDIKLSVDTIKVIYQVCCDIWENCNYNQRDYPIGVYRTYLNYQKEYDFKKLVILSQAIGQSAIQI